MPVLDPCSYVCWIFLTRTLSILKLKIYPDLEQLVILGIKSQNRKFAKKKKKKRTTFVDLKRANSNLKPFVVGCSQEKCTKP